MLRPVETPTREIKKLDGLWAFSLDRENCGIDQRWWESVLQESRAIAVPGSFNDQFADADIRNYVGNVWYQREVFIPKGWAGQRIVLRFDAVTHYGKVWVNNQEVMEHQGGYTPFEADVTPYVIAVLMSGLISPFCWASRIRWATNSVIVICLFLSMAATCGLRIPSAIISTTSARCPKASWVRETIDSTI
jgi:hypothetical protein